MIVWFVKKIDEHSVTGGEYRLYTVLKYMEDKGIQIKFLQTPGKSAFNRIYLLSSLSYIYRYFSSRNREKELLVENYSDRFSLVPFNIFIRLFTKTKIVGMIGSYYYSYRKLRLKNLIDRLVSFFFFKTLDAIIISGDSAGIEPLKAGFQPEKITAIYPALRDEFINYDHTFRERKRNQEGPIRLLFVGRLHPVKGLESLLNAMSLLKNESMELFIVGDCSTDRAYSDKINELARTLDISDRVRMLGRIASVTELIRVYEEADIFVLPSLWDTSPIAVVEAMCVGLPVVATRTGGIPEFVEDAVTGFLVPPGDYQALANALRTLSIDEQRRLQLGRQGLLRARKYKDRNWDDVGKMYYEVFMNTV